MSGQKTAVAARTALATSIYGSSRPHGSCRPLFRLASARVRLKAAAAITVVILVGAPAFAQQAVLPTGGSVASGGVTIVQPNATTLNINQSTNQAIINWNTFSVGRGDTVNFNQPGASSSTLNRVTGSTPSWIAGTINAPGTVLLVNPNGIEITKSGVINAGSFAASTLNIKDSDYLSGHYNFSGNGASAGVINNGRINVSDGGFAALLGGQVANNGVISARLGKVALGAGELITLDLSGDGFLSVAVPSSQLGNLVNGNGALVNNKGKINARGGTVFLSAATASNILRNAVNMGGSVRANSVGVHNGRIVINGGAGGAVNITGRLAANGGRRHKGGTVEILGKQIKITGKISANGATGGSVDIAASDKVWISGTVAVPGLTGAGGNVAIPGDDIILSSAMIDASGATGGKVSVISSGNLAVSGTIAAFGNNPGQSGGVIETSGQTVQIGGRIDAGRGGSWLLDPNDLTINSTLAATIDAALNAGTNVTEQTTLSGTGGNGDIFVNSPISWATSASFTLSAYRNVNVDANIASTKGGTVTLRADNTGTGVGTVTFGGGDKVSTSGAVAIFYNPSVNPAGSVVNGASYVNPTENFAGDVTGGAALTVYMLVNTVYDLQNVQNNLAANYALGTNIDATVTSGWNSGAGFAPIGSFSVPCNCFAGIFDGGGNTISNLTINLPTNVGVGLFAAANGTIRNVTLSNVNVTGTQDVGALVGQNEGSISNVVVIGTSTVTGSGGNNSVGGLVGFNDTGATIANSSSDAAVSNSGAYAGGLVGQNFGSSIANSYATGNVSGYAYVGGLIGNNAGPVSNVYATGNVTGGIGNGASNIGGLIGANSSTVTQAYASGVVISDTSLFHGVSFTGGLIGYDTGSISQSYATGSVTGAQAVGGLVGGQFGGSITDSYAATGSVSGNGYIGGLVGESENGGTITNVYAANQLSGLSGIGGLVGVIDIQGHGGATISHGYWNTDTAGASFGTHFPGIGQDSSGNTQSIQGLTTAQLQGSQPPDSLNPGALPSGFDTAVNGACTTCWGIVPGQTYPLLLWQPGVIAGTVYTTFGGSSAGSGITVSDVINGVAGSTAVTSTSGSYLFYLGATGIPSGAQVLVYTTGPSGGVSYQQNASRAASGLNIYGTYLSETTPVASASSLASGLTAAINGTTNTALQTEVNGLANNSIAATGTIFAIDQAITTGTLVISSTGTITQSAAITASGTVTLSAYGNVNVDANIASTGGGTVTLRADNTATGIGTVTFGSGGKVSTSGAVAVFYNPSVNPAGSEVHSPS